MEEDAQQMLPLPPVRATPAEIAAHWFHVTFPGSVVAQTTEQWNFLIAARDNLAQLLTENK